MKDDGHGCTPVARGDKPPSLMHARPESPHVLGRGADHTGPTGSIPVGSGAGCFTLSIDEEPFTPVRVTAIRPRPEQIHITDFAGNTLHVIEVPPLPDDDFVEPAPDEVA